MARRAAAIAPTEPDPEGERIARRIARAGVCSRRDAEVLIAEGRVAVDGVAVTHPSLKVKAGQRVTVDGEGLREAEPARMWRYHKPRGLLTTTRDPEGRATIFERLPEELPRVVTVGRLDLTSEGLLLLTTDGALAGRLAHPATGWTRRYRVRANGTADEAALAGLAKGMTVDGVRYGPIHAVLDRRQGANVWLTISLAEGKNREVRRVLENIGLYVNRLIRVAYGPFQLGSLARGGVEEVSPKILREQLGKLLPPLPRRADRRR